MSIEVYAVTSDPKEGSKIKVNNKEILSTLGDDSLAVQLKDLFKSVIDSISNEISFSSQINIEVTGSVNLKAQGGIKYLFFNVGGEASTTGAMKVSISTTIQPKK